MTKRCQACELTSQAQLIPWYHYTPVRYDYADVYDTMAFFTGSLDGRHRGKDDLAREIASNGRQFALGRMRWVLGGLNEADQAGGRTCSRICCLCFWRYASVIAHS